MRDNIETVITFLIASIFFIVLINEFAIFYSDIKYESVTWYYFLTMTILFGLSLLFVGLYIIAALFNVFMIFFEERVNKIVDKYKKWKEENLDDE